MSKEKLRFVHLNKQSNYEVEIVDADSDIEAQIANILDDDEFDTVNFKFCIPNRNS